jgi:serine O-acetyltransferase
VISEDLRANSKLRGWYGIAIAYVIVPGFRIVARHRMAFAIRGTAVGRAFGKLLWLANANAGVFIAPSSKIGRGLRLPHPATIVIGDDVIVGANVTIYQGVTLGRKSSKVGDYPVVGDGVTIYAGATVIGNVRIGDGAVIGAHAVVQSDVPIGGIAVGIPARVVKVQQRVQS